MCSLELVQTDRSRKCFTHLIDAVSDSKRKLVEEISKKDVITMDDISVLEDTVPSDTPALFGLLFEFRRVREPDYKASAAFKAKTERLKLRMAERDYQKLIETVDPSQGYGNTPLLQDIGADMRTMNRQIGVIVNFLITVVGGFFFGFTGITYAYPARQFDLATRFLLGLILATIIFFADLYFLIKNMDEELAARPNASSKVNAPLDLKKMNASVATTKENKKDK